MPVYNIIYQPLSAQLLAAYRPIRFQVLAVGTFGNAVPPFVSCDIYVEDVYYKSMIRTAPDLIAPDHAQFTFDIADALQEYLQPDIAVIDNQNILLAPHMSAKVYCKFRASDIDINGFTVEEATAPIQGTKFTDPVAGTGLVSNSFYAVNSALQHEDNQNLASHLNAYKQGAWHQNAYPLSHRRKYFFCDGDSDHFPVLFNNECVDVTMQIHYRYKNELATQTANSIDINLCEAIEFTTDVTANQVTVTLDDPIDVGYVLVRYRKKNTVGAEWIDAGQFTSQTFSFFLQPSGQFYVFAGLYDIQVIHFCTTCLSETSTTGEFEMTGEVVNNSWRGINEYCVYQTFPGPVYVVLELRNQDVDEIFLPTSTVKNSRKETTANDLYAKFFSDAAHLNPVTVTQDGLKVVVKRVEAISQVTATDTHNKIVEDIVTYNVDTNGTEVLLGNVITKLIIDTYGPYPTITSTSTSDFTFSMYPDHVLQEGNTGFQGFTDLQEYNLETNNATGVTKTNDEGDPDYIAPVLDTTSCPQGPDRTTLLYGSKLEIAKVEFKQGSQFYFAPTVSDTDTGGYQFIQSLQSQKTTHISVKSKTLDPSNTTGFVQVRVTWVAGGVTKNQTFPIPNNVEKQLNQLFKNVQSVTITNL